MSNTFPPTLYGVLFVFPFSSITGIVKDGVRKVTIVHCTCPNQSKVHIVRFKSFVLIVLALRVILSIAVDLTIVIVIIVIFSIITMKARRPHIIGKCYMKMRAAFKTISFETYVVF